MPGAPLLLIGGVAARLGQGVTVLAWILLVQQTTSSFGVASLVAASTSLATAVAAPVGGRLADRFGARRVLPWYGSAYALAQLTLLVATLDRRRTPAAANQSMVHSLRSVAADSHDQHLVRKLA